MSKTNLNNDPDSSSDSSWTLLEELVDSNEFVDVVDEKDNAGVCNPVTDDQSENSDFSLGAWLGLDQDDNIPTKKKSKTSNSKKPREEPLSVMYIVACLFTLAAIALVAAKLPSLEEGIALQKLQNDLNHIKPIVPEDLLKNITTVLSEHLTQSDIDEVCDASEFYNITTENSPSESNLTEDNDAESESKHEDGKYQTFIHAVKNFISSPSLQMFLATLAQDLCLIKIINELNKTTDDRKTNKKVKKIKKVAKKLTKRKDQHESSKSATTPVSDRQVIDKIAKIYGNNTAKAVDETGKSECEKRFEELDNKWNALGENHRQKVHQIREKFQKKIYEIKEKEKETFNRQQKISFTREKFIQRLKIDREIYLVKLAKLREERQKLLDEVCHRYRNSKDFSPKDASVGNCAVIPADFQKSLEKLKEDNNTVGTIDETKVVVNGEKRKLLRKQEMYYNLKKRYFKKKAMLLRKKQAKMDEQEVTEIVKNLINNVSQEDKSTEHNEDAKTVTLGRGSKRNLNKIYDVAFEGQSKKIKQIDFLKWHDNHDNWKAVRREQHNTSKQDPQKMFFSKKWILQ